MTALCFAMLLGLAGGSLQGRAPAPGAGRDPVAEALVTALNEARSEGNRPPVVRDPSLDAVAGRRARETARLPEGRRLEGKTPIEALIREAGRRQFATAMQYLSYQGGYADEAAAAVASWKGYAPGWEQAVGGAWTEAGAATARAGDGTLVIVVVLVEAGRPLPSAETIEEGIVAGVNRERVAIGLEPLALDRRLLPVARAHSADMSRRGYFDHVSPDGVHAADRVSAAGISFAKVAENLFESRGADDPVGTAVASWMRSPGHRATIVDPELTHTAVGVAVDPGAGKVTITQLFLHPPRARP